MNLETNFKILVARDSNSYILGQNRNYSVIKNLYCLKSIYITEHSFCLILYL